MKFHATRLGGAYVIEPDPYIDERGLFARTFCAREFGDQGLTDTFVQCSVSWNARKGTLRGLHYQLPPTAEAKLVRCTAGSIWDVIVDLRPDSPTYLQSVGVELSAQNRRALYIPEMIAHGFQTLEDGAEVFYQMTAFHAPDLAAGLRYSDPKLGILWPLPVATISEKDTWWPLLP
jgi:dTDP-4-dehydrorhamnose 3,5-epimerase